MPRPSRSTRRLLAAATLLAAAACGDALPTADPTVEPDFTVWEGRDHRALRVLTWNAYLGGDTGPLFTLDFTDVPAVLQAVNTFWGQVQASDIDGRMAAIARQVEATRPHLVSLQEVVQFAVVDLTTGQVTDGTDLLASLQGALARRGLDYQVVAVQNNTSSALPLSVDFSTGQITEVLSFTDRVAVLRRGDVEIDEVAQGTYRAGFDLGPLMLTRGFIRASLEFDDEDYHLVNTHLETQGLAPVQAAQLQELLGEVMAGLEGVTVLTGDLNSDAEAGPGDPSWTETYDILRGAGFHDAWLRAAGSKRRPGVTCCQAPDLRNRTPELDERIDFVLVRVTDDDHVARRLHGGVRMEVVGEEPRDRTAGSGLWPADHAGLAAMLRLNEDAEEGRRGRGR